MHECHGGGATLEKALPREEKFKDQYTKISRLCSKMSNFYNGNGGFFGPGWPGKVKPVAELCPQFCKFWAALCGCMLIFLWQKLALSWVTWLLSVVEKSGFASLRGKKVFVSTFVFGFVFVASLG